MNHPDPKRGRTAHGGVLTALTALALSAAGYTSTAHAQLTPPLAADGFDAHLFRPAIDSKGQFTVNGSDILGHLEPAFGLVVDYGRDLARVGTNAMGTNRALVENAFTGTLLANFGLFHWVTLGIQVPVYLMSGPNDVAAPGITLPSQGGIGYQGFGDFNVNVKFRFLRSDLTKIGAALIFQAGFPMANSSRFFQGDPGISLWPQLAVEIKPVREFRIDLNFGYRHSFGQGVRVPDDNTGVTFSSPLTFGIGMSLRVIPALDLVLETYGNQYTGAFGNLKALPWEAIGGFKVFVQRNSYLMLGAGGGIPIDNAPASARFRAFIGIIFEPTVGDTDGDGYRDDIDKCPLQPEDFDRFDDKDGCPDPDNDKDGILDVDDHCPLIPEDKDGDHDGDGCPEGEYGDIDGDGILDKDDQCKNEPEDKDQFQDDDGCPDPDNDEDGILDTADGCPNDPEDKDNWEDENGCPDPDNDSDRIPDTADKCKNEPETYNGTDDADGCPDTGDVYIENGQICILRTINFETNSARIRQDSIPIVEAVARTLIGNPQIALVEVQGHADERGNPQHNLQLTQDRATAVVQALVDRGVARDRLHHAGYGSRCRAGFPRTPGQEEINATCQETRSPPRWCHSDRAWSRDRRVVFLILRTTDGPMRVRVACPGAEDLIPEEDRMYHQGGT